MGRGEDDVRLKLLHTSDWHLGHPFRSLDNAAGLTLKRQRLATVDHVLKVAAREEVDAVLCAGDLFDSRTPAEDWWRGLADRLQAMTHRCPVYLLPGNHDPLTPESVYHVHHPFRGRLPDWVHVVDRTGFEAPLGDGAVLLAHPTLSGTGGADPVLALPDRALGDDRIRVGLAHGTAVRFPGGAPDFPIAPDAAVQRSLDYLALGDIHDFVEVHPATPSGVGLTLYCGAPEPMRFGEQGAGSAVLVQLRPHGRAPRYLRERVGHWRWEHVRWASMSEARNLRERADLQRLVLRLTVEMAVSLDERQELDRIVRELRGTEVDSGSVGLVESVDRSAERLVHGAFATQLPAHVPQVMQEVHNRLRAQLNDPELASVAQKALLHLHKIISGGPS